LDTFAEEKLEQSNNYNSKSVNFCWIWSVWTRNVIFATFQFGDYL
jgi:hypothetical protein